MATPLNNDGSDWIRKQHYERFDRGEAVVAAVTTEQQ